MKKRMLFIIIGIGFLVCLMVSILISAGNRKSGIEYLEGQWKTTELTAINRTGTIYWSEEEYLGRSISIKSSGHIEKSIDYWPFYLERKVAQYEYWTSERTIVKNWAGKAGIGNITGWYDKHRDEEVEVVSFYQCEDDYKAGYDPVEIYIIFEDGSVQVQWLEGCYMMERFAKAKTNLQPEELYGTWDVERFVSYKDNWIGNKEQLENCKSQIESFAPELSGWENAEGIDFYPKDYYNYSLIINKERLFLLSDNRYVELHEIQQYDIQQADRKAYEKEKGINDELGISNEKIEVIVAEPKDGDKEGILDNEIVVIDKTRIIMKIDEGWFLLTKE